MSTDNERLAWREHMRRWRSDNPERARELCREYYIRNRDRIREQQRQYRIARKAKLSAPLQEPLPVDP